MVKHEVIFKIKSNVDITGDVSDNMDIIWDCIAKQFEEAVFCNIKGVPEKFLTIKNLETDKIIKLK